MYLSMVVEAALTGDKDLVRLAMMHDPLTGAVLNPPEIYHLADAMFDALAEWLPQFNGEGRTWEDRPLPNGGCITRIADAGDYRPPKLA